MNVMTKLISRNILALLGKKLSHVNVEDIMILNYLFKISWLNFICFLLKC